MTGRYEAGNTVAYEYAGLDQTELLGIDSTYGERWYAYGRTDANGLPVIEAYTGTAGEHFVLRDPQGTPLLLDSDSGEATFLATDGLGSVAATVNADGTHTASYTYSPDGATTVANHTGYDVAAANPFTYAGGTTDLHPASDLLHLGHRWYDTTDARFTQQDPIETLADPRRANRYEYANGNSINYVDPTGLIPWACIGSLISFGGSVVGAVGAAASGVGAAFAGALFWYGLNSALAVDSCS
jgi:RHS repeat-associated protein